MNKTMQSPKEFLLHVTLEKTAGTVKVQAGTACSFILILKNKYIISPGSFILNSGDMNNTQLKNQREHYLQQNILTKNPHAGETLRVAKKIKCLNLNDALTLIIGTELPDNLDLSNLQDNTIHQYEIPVNKIPVQKSSSNAVKTHTASKRSKKISELTVDVSPNLECENTWDVTCTSVYDPASNPDIITAIIKINSTGKTKYRISKGSYLLDQDLGLSQQIVNTRKKLLEAGQIKQLSTGKFRAVKPLFVSSQDTLFQLITGYPVNTDKNVLQNEPCTWTCTLASPETDTLNHAGKKGDAVLPESVSFIKVPEDNQILICCINTVSTVSVKRDVYSLLPQSQILTNISLASPSMQKYRAELKEQKTVSEDPQDPCIMIVEDKLRFQSFSDVLEMITGIKWELPFQSYDEMPDEYTCKNRIIDPMSAYL